MALDPSIVLLVGADAIIADESNWHRSLTPVGVVGHTTAPKKFGTGALSLLGGFGGLTAVGGWIQMPAAPELNFGSSDFTVEGWFRFEGKTNNQTLIGQWGGTSTQSWRLSVEGGKLTFVGYPSGTVANPWVPILGQWYHIAVDRLAGYLRGYVGGTVIIDAPVGFDTFAISADPLVIGARGPAGDFPVVYFNGYMDEIRITNGVAQYGGAFTAPTAPFSRGLIVPTEPRPGQFYYVRPDHRWVPVSASVISGTVASPTTLADSYDGDPATVALLNRNPAAPDDPVIVRYDLGVTREVEAVAIVTTNVRNEVPVDVSSATHLFHQPASARQPRGLNGAGRTPNIWYDLRAEGSPSQRSSRFWTISMLATAEGIVLGEVWFCAVVSRLLHGVSWGASYEIAHPYIQVETNAGATFRYGYGGRRRAFRGQTLTPNQNEYYALREWSLSCGGTQPTLIVPPEPRSDTGEAQPVEPWVVHWASDVFGAVRNQGYAHTIPLEFEELSPGAPLP